MAKSRNFFEQRKDVQTLSHRLHNRQYAQPRAVKQLRERCAMGGAQWGVYQHGKYEPRCLPWRASRLREVLHCFPQVATSWGCITNRAVVREILVRARCGRPGVLSLFW